MGDKGHERFDELMDAALDGSLTAAEREEFDDHVAICSDCRDTSEMLGAATDAWKDQPDIQLDGVVKGAVADRVMDGITGQPARHAARPSRPAWTRIAVAVGSIAAAALVLVIVGSMGEDEASVSKGAVASEAVADSSHMSGGDALEQEAAPVPARKTLAALTVAVEGNSVVTALDEKPVPITDETSFSSGDIIALNGDAVLDVEIPTVARLHLEEGAVLEINRNDDGVSLDLRRGRLACHVSKRGQGEEFEVVTPAGAVEVTGTVFQVEVMATAEAAVKVAEGRVLVRDAADERNVVALVAGQRMNFDWSNPVAQKLEADQSGALLALFGLSHREPAVATVAAKSAPSEKVVRNNWEKKFEEALALRGAGNLEGAIQLYQEIARGASGRMVRADAAFAVGQLRYQSNNLEGAISQLDRNSGLFSGTPYRAMALFYSAQASFKLGKCSEATRTAEKFLATAPSHRMADRVRGIVEACAAR